MALVLLQRVKHAGGRFVAIPACAGAGPADQHAVVMRVGKLLVEVDDNQDRPLQRLGGGSDPQPILQSRRRRIDRLRHLVAPERRVGQGRDGPKTAKQCDQDRQPVHSRRHDVKLLKTLRSSPVHSP